MEGNINGGPSALTKDMDYSSSSDSFTSGSGADRQDFIKRAKELLDAAMEEKAEKEVHDGYLTPTSPR